MTLWYPTTREEIDFVLHNFSAFNVIHVGLASADRGLHVLADGSAVAPAHFVTVDRNGDGLVTDEAITELEGGEGCAVLNFEYKIITFTGECPVGLGVCRSNLGKKNSWIDVCVLDTLIPSAHDP